MQIKSALYVPEADDKSSFSTSENLGLLEALANQAYENLESHKIYCNRNMQLNIALELHVRMCINAPVQIQKVCPAKAAKWTAVLCSSF